jgi:NAD(P)-dependent dehydrogenase (short-subunit alcohol dehydrogenase family)
MVGRLEGKTAIITGAAQGQGAAAARIFADEGARVAILDMNGDGAAKVAAEIGSADVIPVACDVSDAASVQSAVAEVIREFGRIDILHNNAGAAFRRGGEWDDSQDGPTLDITEALFDKSIAVNLKSVFLMAKNVLPHMIEQGSGSIINVSSVSGPNHGSSSHAYAAAKAGVVGLTRSLAVTYSPKGVRVNAICPGVIETPLVAHIVANPSHIARYAEGSPLGRLGQPEDIARVALFLASEDSGFMTGSVLTADGGVTIN